MISPTIGEAPLILSSFAPTRSAAVALDVHAFRVSAGLRLVRRSCERSGGGPFDLEVVVEEIEPDYARFGPLEPSFVTRDRDSNWRALRPLLAS